jgi:hypothetical protein
MTDPLWPFSSFVTALLAIIAVGLLIAGVCVVLMR